MRVFAGFFVSLWITFNAHAQEELLVNGKPVGEASGQEIYRATCAGCHGVDGTGNPRETVGFDVPLPDFTDCSFSTPETEADWMAVVYDGGPVRAFDRKMPAFGDLLTVEQIRKVVDYVRDLCEDDDWPRGELNLPRPLVTEKAFPENEAVVTTTVGRDPGSVVNRFLYERRIGSRSQYEVIVPFSLLRRDSQIGWNRGLGDIELGFKHVLFHSNRRGLIFSAGSEVELPTGKETEDLGGGKTMIAPFVSFGQILPRDGFLQLQGKIERPITHDPANIEAIWRGAVGKTFTQGRGRTWSPMLEILGARVLESGARSEWDVVPQMQVSISKRQHILVNAGFRIPVTQRQGRQTTFMIYFLWDWFDGGLFSGW
jgi:mono/diheme cytochrome c family protein